MARVPKTPLALVCAAVLSGCGSDSGGTIPSASSDALITLLDAIEDDVAAGDCELAQAHASEFVAEVNELPNEVDNDVQRALTESAARVTELSGDPEQCETGATGPDGAEPTTSSTTEDTTTSTTTDETTEDTTTDEEPEEEDEGEQQQAEEPEQDETPNGGGPPQGTPGGGPPEVEIGPSDSGGIDPERRRP